MTITHLLYLLLLLIHIDHHLKLFYFKVILLWEINLGRNGLLKVLIDRTKDSLIQQYNLV